MPPPFTCTITLEDIQNAWRTWLKDPTAELPPDLLDDVSAGFIEAAMEDAGLMMLRVLLVDRAMERLNPG